MLGSNRYGRIRKVGPKEKDEWPSIWNFVGGTYRVST